MVVMAFTFEVENRIDDMFEGFWSGDRTVLGDMADQKNGNRPVLCEQQKLMGHLTYL